MPEPFQTVGIIARLSTVGVQETIRLLITHILKHNRQIIIEKDTALLLSPDHGLPIIEREQLGAHCDLMIVVGGDGSLLNAAHAAIDHEIPVLGINRGSLGFLTDIHPTEFNKIEEILSGKYWLEERFFLTAHIFEEGILITQGNALNEIALLPDNAPHMIEFEIYIDQQFVCSQSADGLIIATPTGSTAYALSGGGPILHPTLNAMVLVPMFPHTLSMRPLVISADQTVEVKLGTRRVIHPRLSCDGLLLCNLNPGNTYQIRKKSKKLYLIHPLEYDYFEALRNKLHWSTKLQQC